MKMKPALFAALLAMVPAGAGGAEPINLRDYWILAEIVNPTAGERADFRVDCRDQDALLCKGGESSVLALGSAVTARRRAQTGGPPDKGAWPEFIRLEILPFFPGIVGYVASGAGGFAVSNDRWLDNPASKGAAFAEVRSAKGFSAPISTVRGGKWLQRTDVHLTMWLVTPTELAIRDAAEKAKKTPAGKPAAEAPGLLDRLRKLF